MSWEEGEWLPRDLTKMFSLDKKNHKRMISKSFPKVTKKDDTWGVPTEAQWVKNLKSIHEDADSISDLRGLRIWCCHAGCGIGCRCGLNLTWLCLWWRPEPAALIWPLAWELPYATGMPPRPPKKKMIHESRVLIYDFISGYVVSIDRKTHKASFIEALWRICTYVCWKGCAMC